MFHKQLAEQLAFKPGESCEKIIFTIQCKSDF